MKRSKTVTGGAWAMAIVLLSTTCSAAEPAPLQDVLQQTGKVVSRFLDQFSEVTCTEVVSQEKLRKDGKREYMEESTFDLLVTVTAVGDELSFDESRLSGRQGKRTKNLPLLVTNGFSTLLLIFHPYHQRSFDYSLLGEEVVNGKRLLRVGFKHVKGTPSPSALLLRGRDYPLELAGAASIDPQSGVVVRITAELQSSMDDVGLRTFRSEVQYAPTPLPGLSEPYWLPVSALIDVETPRQHWRNLHQFTRYKRFEVTTEASVEPPS